MAKHETAPQEETIALTRTDLATMVNEAIASAVGVAVKAALAAQAPTPERRRVDAQQQVDEHLASLRPKADRRNVRVVACLTPNGARFDAVESCGSQGWRVVRLDNYREPEDLLERMAKLAPGLARRSPEGKLTPETKHWISQHYLIAHINRYVSEREPLPIDHEEMERRANAKPDEPVAAE
jgi:hypothetical protein